MSIVQTVKFKNTKNTPHKEGGAILVESAIIAPFLILLFLFCSDFLAYTKSQTFLAQVARDNAIYFAIIPGAPLPGTYSDLSQGEFHDEIQLCEANSFSDPICLHLATQVRTMRAIIADGKTLNLNSIKIETSYDNTPDNENVSLNIIANKKILFWTKGKSIETRAVLRKVNL